MKKYKTVNGVKLIIFEKSIKFDEVEQTVFYNRKPTDEDIKILIKIYKLGKLHYKRYIDNKFKEFQNLFK